ncbi:hypothetical protein [Parvularcula oceani]|uniref:hypothetical protein n=1 Tax=Parvularcula oceani TaxID=1247963 RepID=UPI0012DFC5D3|nr:hypothetical protein [Parvularcula oceani]
MQPFLLVAANSCEKIKWRSQGEKAGLSPQRAVRRQTVVPRHPDHSRVAALPAMNRQRSLLELVSPRR